MTAQTKTESASSVTFLCPACSGPVTATNHEPSCPSCAVRIELRGDSGGSNASLGDQLQQCRVCGSEALYVAKDFNKKLGVAIVAVGCIGFYWGPIVGVATLVGLTLLDRLVYYLRPLVTVCYACKAVYRDVTSNPAHKPYELMYDETFEGTGEPPGYSKD